MEITFFYQFTNSSKTKKMIFFLKPLFCFRSILQFPVGAGGRDSFNGDLIGELGIKLRTPFWDKLRKSLGLSGRAESRGRTQPPSGQQVIFQSVDRRLILSTVRLDMINVVNIVTHSQGPKCSLLNPKPTTTREKTQMILALSIKLVVLVN